jgi:hypothetical protein
MKENEAIKMLEVCEQNLRNLVAEAVQEGDYPGVLRITDWAKALASLVAEGRGGQPASINAPSIAEAKSDGINHSHPALAIPAESRRARHLSDGYPKFFRRGDELVKVGWSKKERKEYNHRAPRDAINAAAASIRQVGAKGKLFNGDALLPLKNPTNGTVVPDYQAYVALAWLKHLGIVEQRGRRAGYTLIPSKQIDSAITTAWPELSEWRG